MGVLDLVPAGSAKLLTTFQKVGGRSYQCRSEVAPSTARRRISESMGIGKSPNRELLPFLRKLAPEFDRFSRRGTLLIHEPVSLLLGGFCFEPKQGDRTRRWLQFFIQPLFVPYDYVILDWGWRIPRRNSSPVFGAPPVKITGSSEEIGFTISAMREEGLCNLVPALTLQGFYDFVAQRNSTPI